MRARGSYTPFNAGWLPTHLELKADGLKRTISEASNETLDGPGLQAALEAAQAERVVLGQARPGWRPEGPGVTATVAVPYTGSNLALQYRSGVEHASLNEQNPHRLSLDSGNEPQLTAARHWQTPPPAEVIRTWQDQVVDWLQDTVARSNRLIEQHNADLETLVEARTAERRASLSALQQLRDELGPPTDD